MAGCNPEELAINRNATEALTISYWVCRFKKAMKLLAQSKITRI
jgi:hypothetical protein